MIIKLSGNFDYNESEILDEIVRARLFDDYENLSHCDNPKKMRKAYEKVLRYITLDTDPRLKVFDNTEEL